MWESGEKKKEWGGEGEMPTLSGREEGREKKRGEREGVFSHADHLTGPYIFACGPIKRSMKIDFHMWSVNQPRENIFCMREQLWSARNLKGVLSRKINFI